MSDPVNQLSVAWSRSAEKAFLSTLEKIELEDVGTAGIVLKRVDKAISLLSIQPGLGTFTAASGVRRYPIPNTGHTINYRVVHGELRIIRWYRQRRNHKI